MRRLIAALLVSTFATGAVATDLGQMTDAERTAFRTEVRQYLLDNPEVLMEAMDVLRARDAAVAAAKEQGVLVEHADAFFASPDDWVGGNPDGDVTMVEFMDYRCGYCRKAYSEVEELIRADGNIRFIVKEFPILGEDSLTSARFAVAVKLIHGDAAYEAAHDAMIAMKGQPDAAGLSQVATDLGHDPEPILARMGADEVTAILKTNHGTADLLEITGTPTFIIGNQVIRGYLPLADLQAVVAEVRAAK
jgi:protein-disulfide isomerase